MKRRLFLTNFALMCVALPAFGQSDVLQEAFEAMPDRQKHWVQNQLHLMGLYTRFNTDGRFGPMTRSALVEAAELVARRTGNEMVFNLSNPVEASDFLNKMAYEQFMFIYDDGYEG